MASQALLKAISSARFTQTRLLLQMTADINSQDHTGQTPLIRALFLPDPKVRTRMMTLLLKAGARVSKVDKRKRNALMWACHLGQYADFLHLLRGADLDLDINGQDEDGATALWMAASHGMTDMVRDLVLLLTRYDLRLEVADNQGVTPAMRAAQLGHPHVLQVMKEHLDARSQWSQCHTTLIDLASVNNVIKTLAQDEHHADPGHDLKVIKASSETAKHFKVGKVSGETMPNLNASKEPSVNNVLKTLAQYEQNANPGHDLKIIKAPPEPARRFKGVKDPFETMPSLKAAKEATFNSKAEILLPDIQVTAWDGPSGRKQGVRLQHAEYVEFVREPTMCSTPASVSRRSSVDSSRSVRASNSRQLTQKVAPPQPPQLPTSSVAPSQLSKSPVPVLPSKSPIPSQLSLSKSPVPSKLNLSKSPVPSQLSLSKSHTSSQLSPAKSPAPSQLGLSKSPVPPELSKSSLSRQSSKTAVSFHQPRSPLPPAPGLNVGNSPSRSSHPSNEVFGGGSKSPQRPAPFACWKDPVPPPSVSAEQEEGVQHTDQKVLQSSAPAEERDVDVYAPVRRPVTMQRQRRSVRDSLPDLFDLMAQQTSQSFRKTAVMPPASRRRGGWSKIRGITLITARLNKLVSRPAKKRSSAGRPDKSGLMAGLFLAKRKISTTRRSASRTSSVTTE